jgi:hypothetical protein
VGNNNFAKDHKISQCSTVTAGAAGTSDINATSVDMLGFEQVTFIVPMGAIVSGAVTSIKVQGSSDNSTWSIDLAGTSQTIADTDDDKTFYVNVVKPSYRYVRMVVDRGTQNATVGGIIAIQSNPKTLPVSHGTSVSGETHISPAAGTA